MKHLYLLTILVFAIMQTFAQTHVSLNVETKKLHNKKVVSSNYELLINCDNSEIVMHYFSPNEFYVFTNRHGEMKAYYPDKNEVLRQQNMLFSSNNDPIYQFFTNQAQDLGLAQMGFTIEKSELDEQYLVTEWVPPIELLNQMHKVKLVQQDHLPIFISYFDTENNVKQRIYFSEWNMESFAIFPMRITQIDYLPNNDSIISKKSYSQLLTGSAALNQFPKVEIPSDAKLIKTDNK